MDLLDQRSFELPSLDYASDALAPALSRHTLQLHHGAHHRGYVEKLNELLEHSSLKGETLATLLRTTRGALYENAAQHYNHSLYWRCLCPGGSDAENGIDRAVGRAFGGMHALKDRFLEAAGSIFGSGWCWLLVDDSGELSIEGTSNADVPLSAGRFPLLVCDVWEHAYYLDYKNDRGAYLEAFWSSIDWRYLSTRWRIMSSASSRT